MKIGKVKKVVKLPDAIPAKLPKKPKRIKVNNWPVKQPTKVPLA